MASMDMYKGVPGAAGKSSSNGGNTGEPNGMRNEAPKGKAPSAVGLAANSELDNSIVRMRPTKNGSC